MENTEAGYAALGKIHLLRSTALLNTSAQQSRDLLFAVRSGNYHLFHDVQHNLIGYVIWAAINRESWLMLKCHQPPIYLSEWNEGQVMLPIDIVILPEWRAGLQTLLRPVRRRLPLLAAWRAGRDRQPRLYTGGRRAL